jgi:hypothetical protein
MVPHIEKGKALGDKDEIARTEQHKRCQLVGLLKR